MQTSEIFSCLFVKFVLYTAGFLGEGTLLFFAVCRQIGHFVLIFFVTWARFTEIIIINIKTKQNEQEQNQLGSSPYHDVPLRNDFVCD